MELQRLSRLSDIIFAVAMTIMALTFEPLPQKEMTPQEVTAFVQQQLPSLAVYILTFVGIAFYWITHLQQFRYYKQTDTVHIWLTLLSLLFVVLLPYANDLSTVYDGVFLIQCFYSLSAAGVGIFSTASWIYATKNRRLVSPDLSDQAIRQIRQESYVEPIVSLLAIVGALIHPLGWILTFILGFPFIFLIQRLFRIEE
ncbi:MAG: TMEM175 family protein [Rivularia sp. (in: cyanobacteria)]